VVLTFYRESCWKWWRKDRRENLICINAITRPGGRGQNKADTNAKPPSSLNIDAVDRLLFLFAFICAAALVGNILKAWDVLPLRRVLFDAVKHFQHLGSCHQPICTYPNPSRLPFQAPLTGLPRGRHWEWKTAEEQNHHSMLRFNAVCPQKERCSMEV